MSAIAAEYQVTDGPDDTGRDVRAAGQAVRPLPAALPQRRRRRALANGGALPPDLSLITKARADGTDYVYSLLQGYEEPPAGEEGLGGDALQRLFPQPLDRHAAAAVRRAGSLMPTARRASIEQMASDVAMFLSWAAEPTLEERKQTGLKVLLFLIILTGLLYATKRKIWAAVH